MVESAILQPRSPPQTDQKARFDAEMARRFPAPNPPALSAADSASASGSGSDSGSDSSDEACANNTPARPCLDTVRKNSEISMLHIGPGRCKDLLDS